MHPETNGIIAKNGNEHNPVTVYLNWISVIRLKFLTFKFD